MGGGRKQASLSYTGSGQCASDRFNIIVCVARSSCEQREARAGRYARATKVISTGIYPPLNVHPPPSVGQTGVSDFYCLKPHPCPFIVFMCRSPENLLRHYRDHGRRRPKIILLFFQNYNVRRSRQGFIYSNIFKWHPSHGYWF